MCTAGLYISNVYVNGENSLTNFAQSIPTGAPGRRTRRKPRVWLRTLAWGAGGLVLAVCVYFVLIWPWLSRWGATNAEMGQTLPGDELIVNPAFITTKAVTIHTSPPVIWSWLVQLGVDRGGMYSYLWVENGLMRLHVRNSDEIRPEFQTLHVGDFIRFTPPDYALNPGPGLYVMAVEPNHALAGCFGMENTPPDCAAGGTWQFVLAAQDDGATRLLLRSRGANPGSALGIAGGKMASVFPFYMERKMLLGIKARAEKSEMHQ